MAAFDAEDATPPSVREPNTGTIHMPVFNAEKSTPFSESTTRPVTITNKHQLIRR